MSCPQCGSISEIIDGDYTMKNGVTTYMELRATPIQLRRLETALNWAQSQLANPIVDEQKVEAQIRQTLKKEAPALVRMADQALSERGAALGTWIGVLLAILALFVSSQSSTIIPEMIEEIVEQVVEQQRESDSPIPGHSNTPPADQSDPDELVVHPA
jgi:hypothetical protein